MAYNKKHSKKYAQSCSSSSGSEPSTPTFSTSCNSGSSGTSSYGSSSNNTGSSSGCAKSCDVSVPSCNVKRDKKKPAHKYHYVPCAPACNVAQKDPCAPNYEFRQWFEKHCPQAKQPKKFACPDVARCVKRDAVQVGYKEAHANDGLKLLFKSPLVLSQVVVPFQGRMKPLDVLAGAQCETPTGYIVLKFARDLSSLQYKLWLYSASGSTSPNQRPTQAHLHLGKAGAAGPIVAKLWEYAPLNQIGLGVDGFLASGTLTNADICPAVTPCCPVCVVNIAALYDAIRAGSVYAHVHGSNACPGTDFSNGLVRGQIY